MTREEWDDRWLERFDFYYREHGRSVDRARDRAWAETTYHYGTRPDEKKSLRRLPTRYRILLSWMLKRLDTVAKGATGMSQKLLYAALYGLSAVTAALQASGIPQDEQGWIGLAGVFMVAFWGKLAHSDNLVSPNKAIWSPEERAAKVEAKVAETERKEA